MSRFDAVQAAQALVPWLREHAGESEALRQLSPAVAARLAEGGLYRLLTPRACGGEEVPVATFVRSIEAVATGDAAAAWCTMIGCTACVVAAYLPPAEAQALFGEPGRIACGVYAPRGQARRGVEQGVAGFHVQGRWPWGSGAQVAHVATAGCLVIGGDGKPELLPDGTPRVQLMLLERGQFKPLGNWDSLGLRGTGSGEFEVAGVFVPATRSVCVSEQAPLPTPLYRFPIFGLLACGIAAVALGVAERAIESFVDTAVARVPQGSARPLAERATAQEALARAVAMQRAARAGLHEAMAAAWSVAERGEAIPVNERRDLRLAASHATHSAAQVVERLFTLAGGHAVFESHPLARCLRDVHMATQHLMVAEPTFELTGRLLMGLPAATGQL